MKQLLQARDETRREGVTGGAWHALTNTFSRILGKNRKPLFATVAAAGILAVGLTGCSTGGAGAHGGGTAKPTATSSSAAADNCASWKGVKNAKLGDAIPKVEVKDKYGSYCHVAINPSSGALTYDASKVVDPDSIKAAGFTEDDIQKAQKAAVTYFVEGAADSGALDNDSYSVSAWKKENGKFFTDPDAYLAGVTDAEALSTTKGLTIGHYLPTPIVRDGGPRFKSVAVNVAGIGQTKMKGTGEAVLIIRLTGSETFSVSNKQVVDAMARNYGKSADEIVKEHPEFANKDGYQPLTAQGTFLYAFKASSKDFSKMDGSHSDWTLTAGTNAVAVAE